jgi:hypothetical protein
MTPAAFSRQLSAGSCIGIVWFPGSLVFYHHGFGKLGPRPLRPRSGRTFRIIAMLTAQRLGLDLRV